ncbi:hypothetical protein V8C44DRAFT_94071 [Trichoderma aethiopicum]
MTGCMRRCGLSYFSPLGRPRRGSVTTVLFWLHTLPLPGVGNVNHHRQPPVQSRSWPPQPRCWAAASRSSDHIICSESKQANAPDTSGLGLSAASHPLCLSGCRIRQHHDRQRFAVAELRAAAKPAPSRQPAPSYQLKIFGSGLGFSFSPSHKSYCLTRHVAPSNWHHGVGSKRLCCQPVGSSSQRP